MVISSESKRTGNENSVEKKATKGVELLIGNPKKAIISLSIPMFINFGLLLVLQIVDLFWIGGLGGTALAAAGFVLPFFMIVEGVITGLSAGGGIFISQAIGHQNKELVDKVAAHLVVMLVSTSIVITVLFLGFMRPILEAMGAGNTIDLAMPYAMVTFGGVLLFFITRVGATILVNEGDSKRALQTVLSAVVINLILDPILIYGADMGIVGAAWASIIAMLCSSLLLLYFFFIKRDTYTTIKFQGFKFELKTAGMVFAMGLSGASIVLFLAIRALLITIAVVNMVGIEGVAAYFSGTRVLSFLLLPINAISFGVVPVISAAFGAGDFTKIKFSYRYALKITLIIEAVILAISVSLAPQISAIFASPEESAMVYHELTKYLQISPFALIAAALTSFTTSLLLGLVKPIGSIIHEFFKTLFFAVPLAIVFGYMMDDKFTGILIGTVVGMFVYVPFALIVAQQQLKITSKLLPHQGATVGIETSLQN